jgi:hypothetical protein
MTNKKNLLRVLLLFLIVSLFFRIDFRFKNSVECCSDDYDYYSHAATVAIDADFDYTNQLTSDHPYVYKNPNNGKIAPVGFPGSGLLASPFLLIGNLIDKNLNTSSGNEVLNYKLLFYSLSPIFYFFLSFVLMYKSLLKLNFDVDKYKLLIIISGSGVSYFAFERFSMTHVYEMFSISLLIWHCIRFYKDNSTLSAILIPISIAIGLLVRLSNIYIFLIPLIIKKLINQQFQITQEIRKTPSLLLSSIATIILYNTISTNIYGSPVYNPQKVYGSNISVGSIAGKDASLLSFIISKFQDIFTILFGNEFGIFWVSPIIFMALFLALKNLKGWINYLFIICLLQNIAIVLIWQSTGASYGFRYLYSLTPLCVVMFFLYRKNKLNDTYFNFLYVMSIFSNLSILFFETTEQTQLSMTEIKNSFGEMKNYSEPKYVTGLLQSFVELESYLIIFTTSLVGVIFFKLVLLLIDSVSTIELLSKIGLPSNNEDFLLYLDNLENMSSIKIILIVVFLLLISNFIVRKLD